MESIFLQYDLQAIEQTVWQLLMQGAASYKAPFHTGTVATAQGNLPHVRTVVLRQADILTKTLSFHTDIRSPKVQQLKQQSQLCWLFYDADLRMQLRITANASLHSNNEIADAAWKASRLAGKLTYTSSSASGTVLNEPELVDVNRTDVEPEWLNIARANFCVVTTNVQQLDWVFLHVSGNRRALFNYTLQQQQWIQV